MHGDHFKGAKLFKFPFASEIAMIRFIAYRDAIAIKRDAPV